MYPYGWLVSWELYVGCISDNTYHNVAGYLKAQEEFQNQDIVAVPLGSVKI